MTDQSYEYLVVESFTTGDQFSQLKPIEFSQTRISPLIDNMEDYNLQIVNFNIPTLNIPLFNYKNPTCKIAIRYMNTANTVDGQTHLYERDVVLTDGSGGSPITFNSNYPPNVGNYNLGRNAVFFVDVFLQAVNWALSQIIVDIENNVGGFLIVPPLPGSKTPPRFNFNPVTELFSLTIPSEYAYHLPINDLRLSCNDILYKLFNGIPVFFNSLTTNPTDSFWFLVYDNGSNLVGSTYTMSQQQSSIPFWISCKKIYVTSNFLKVNPQALTSNLNRSGLSLQQNVIAEFNLNTLTTLNEFYSNLVYTQFNDKQNTISISGSGPIIQFDFQIYYQTSDGEVFQVVTNRGETYSIKFKFTKYR